MKVLRHLKPIKAAETKWKHEILSEFETENIGETKHKHESLSEFETENIAETKQKRKSFAEFETVKSCRNEIETVEVMQKLKLKKVLKTLRNIMFFVNFR